MKLCTLYITFIPSIIEGYKKNLFYMGRSRFQLKYVSIWELYKTFKMGFKEFFLKIFLESDFNFVEREQCEINWKCTINIKESIKIFKIDRYVCLKGSCSFSPLLLKIFLVYHREYLKHYIYRVYWNINSFNFGPGI